jgi:hypothetical protein
MVGRRTDNPSARRVTFVVARAASRHIAVEHIPTWLTVFSKKLLENWGDHFETMSLDEIEQLAHECFGAAMATMGGKHPHKRVLAPKDAKSNGYQW